MRNWTKAKGSSSLVLEVQFPKNEKLFEFFKNNFEYLGKKPRNHLGQHDSGDISHAFHLFKIPLD